MVPHMYLPTWQKVGYSSPDAFRLTVFDGTRQNGRKRKWGGRGGGALQPKRRKKRRQAIGQKSDQWKTSN